ncbi:MAG: carbohydrate porin [Planctomycetales bacterium]|nr:carbohydrate porin [Planctomycetales bacterium]
MACTTIHGSCLGGIGLLGREQLTGDWLGLRPALGEHGIAFAGDLANFTQGVTSGGLERRLRYGGHGDYVTNVDFGKLGIQEGLFLKVRAEHRYLENVNRDTGALLPAAVLADLPATDTNDLLLSNVLFTQMFSEHFGVFFGKLDTLDGDVNAFAHGRGKTQFMNVGFVANPIALRTIPYSTLGLGFAVLGEGGEPLVAYTLMNARDTVDKAGFDELFEDGVAMALEVRLPTQILGLPGHQLFAGTWNSRDFVALGQDPRIVLPNIPVNQTSGSWSLYWNFDQYLHVDSGGEGQGWGVFGRSGIADSESNPLSWFLSFGVGGNSRLLGREADTFGAGWFVAGISDEVGVLAQAVLGPLSDGQGVELFYNMAVTPAISITPDLQVIMPARDNVDPSLVLGVRTVMRL